jgi:hypothetical protein
MNKNEQYNDKINGVRVLYIRPKIDLELKNDTTIALKLESLVLFQEL